MRAATGGLAASDRTMPPSMMAPSATRLNRSIVHHHAANGVRSTRETMGLDSRLCYSPGQIWLLPVNKKFQLPRSGDVPLPTLPRERGRVGRGSSPLRPNRRDHPGKSQHEFAECRAARLEILELIVRRTRRRQQHDGMIAAGCRRVASGFLDGAVEGADDDIDNPAVERFGELLRSGANQIGLADAGKIPRELLDAASFRLAARDPKDIAEARQRLGGGICVG